MLVKLGKLLIIHKYIFDQAFHRLILLIQKNEKINILSVPFINLKFPPSSGTKKGADEWHLDHFSNIFWVKCTFTSRWYLLSNATELLIYDIHLQFVHLIISSTDNARFQIFTSVNDPEWTEQYSESLTHRPT